MSICVHLRFKIGISGPPEPPERPKWTANERKFTQMGLPKPLLTHFRAFRAFRGYFPVFTFSRTSEAQNQPRMNTDRHGLGLSDLGPPTSDLDTRCKPFSAPEMPFAAIFTPKMLLRSPFHEIGITWHPKTGIKPTSRGFSPCLPAPHSPNPQPAAPLTHPRISAIL